MSEGKHSEDYIEKTSPEPETTEVEPATTVEDIVDPKSIMTVDVRKKLYLFCFLMMPTLLVVQSVLAVVDVSRWVTVLVTALISAVGYIGSYVGYQYAGKSK